MCPGLSASCVSHREIESQAEKKAGCFSSVRDVYKYHICLYCFNLEKICCVQTLVPETGSLLHLMWLREGGQGGA